MREWELIAREANMAARMCAGCVFNGNIEQAQRWAKAWDVLNDLYTDELVRAVMGRKSR